MGRGGKLLDGGEGVRSRGWRLEIGGLLVDAIVRVQVEVYMYDYGRGLGSVYF